MLDGYVFTESCKGMFPNTYELDIPREFGINPVFKVENLTSYRTPIDYLTIIPDPSSSTTMGPQHFPVHPPLLPSRRHKADDIKDILQDEVILTVDGEYQIYLVRWGGCPDSDCTWVRIVKF